MTSSLTLAQAARLAHRWHHIIRRAIDSGDIEATFDPELGRPGRGRWHVDPASLDAWVERTNGRRYTIHHPWWGHKKSS